MRIKLFRCFVTITLSAILAVSGVSTTAYAATNVDPAICKHEGLYILEDSGKVYEYKDQGKHTVYAWEEIYCLECFWYVTLTDIYDDSHTYNGDDICDECNYIHRP